VIPGLTSHAAGALAVIRYAKIHGTKHRPWLRALLARRPTKVAAIALANKITRMAWAIMAKGERYKNPSHSRHKQDRARLPVGLRRLDAAPTRVAYRLIQRGTDAACPQCR
jgi:hypothetical protein